MKVVQIDIDIRVKAVIIPETFKEKLKYFFWEQKVIYEVLNNFDVKLSTGETITIKKGFEMDLRTVPPFLHSFMSNCPPNVKAYILHDWLYKKDYFREELGDEKAKEKCDYEMLYLANQLNSDLENQNELSHFIVDKFGNKIFKRREHE